MPGARLAYLTQRLESLLAVANFGASSTFWLATAFLISVDDYGRLMTLQAAILLLVAAFTLRTHDLVYFLTVSHGTSLARAWRAGLAMETLAATLCLTAGLATIFIIVPGRFADPEGSAIFLAVATAVVAQQASIARIRRSGRAVLIRATDGFILVLWSGALLYLLLGFDRDREQLLILGALPQAVRTLLLVGSAALVRDAEADNRTATPWAAVVRYVIGGQAVNFIKNGATSIETSILAAFIAPAPVALYRLTKSTQGIVTAFSNVVFQQGTDALSSARDVEHRSDLLRQLRTRGLRGALAAYPFSVIFALVYAYVKPDVSAVEFQLVMAFSFIALLPQILLQGSFIVISLAGKQVTINLIYLISTVALVVLSGALFVYPSIWVFLAALTGANVARLILLDRVARQVLPSLSARGDQPRPMLDQPEDVAEPAYGVRAS